MIVEHDPKLAKKIYSIYADMSGRSSGEKSYRHWLSKYVRLLAEANGLELVVVRGKKR